VQSLQWGAWGKEEVVQLFAKFHVQQTITDREKVMELQRLSAKQIQELMNSGKVRASGFFADARGGFFVLEVDSAEEVFEVFAPVIDYIRIETHPLIAAEKLGEFFEQQGAMAGS
jgi:hypothetical protein